MSGIFGVLGVEDTEAALLDHIGQGLIFDAINEVLGYHNADVVAATGIFVKGDTEMYLERWMAPGSGMMMPAGQDPFGPPPAVQRYGYWDVSYRLTEYAEAIAGSRVALAYMTLQELDAHLDNIMERNLARHRQLMLIALMESTNLTWADTKFGNLTIRRLANTDGALYPPLPAATVEAQDNHYIDAAYNVAGIAAATNPAADMRDEIIEHFGGRTSVGTDILYLHGSDQTALLAGIAGYVAVGSDHVMWGDDTDLSKILRNVPGFLHGTGWGVWMSEWAWMPDEFGLAVHLGKPPLMRRRDTAASGLPRGLTLVAVNKDFPLQASFYSDRFGYAVGNRLSAACTEINAGGAVYTPPAAYTE